jgi:hypothetical protein
VHCTTSSGALTASADIGYSAASYNPLTSPPYFIPQGTPHGTTPTIWCAINGGSTSIRVTQWDGSTGFTHHNTTGLPSYEGITALQCIVGGSDVFIFWGGGSVIYISTLDGSTITELPSGYNVQGLTANAMMLDTDGSLLCFFLAGPSFANGFGVLKYSGSAWSNLYVDAGDNSTYKGGSIYGDPLVADKLPAFPVMLPGGVPAFTIM